MPVITHASVPQAGVLPIGYFPVARADDRLPAASRQAGDRRWFRSVAYAMGYERHVKLFKNGRSQAVRIPREFELPGTETVMHKEGERLIIEPAVKRSLLEVVRSLPQLDEGIGPIERLPAGLVDL